MRQLRRHQLIEFHGRNNVVVNPLRIKKDILHELQYNLLLCYTGNIHVSANIIKDQVKNYEKKDAFDAMCEVKALAYAMKDELLRGNLHSLVSFWTMAGRAKSA